MTDQKKEYSIIIASIESLYLSVISVLKTLSGNYTSLLILSIIIFLIIYVLSLRIITLHLV